MANWFFSSWHPSEAGLMADLVRELCSAGARVDGVADDSSPLVMAMAFGCPAAIRALVECGARTDNLLFAAATGDLAQVKGYLVDDAWCTDGTDRCAGTWFKIPADGKTLAELALVFACMGGHTDTARFMITSGVDLNTMPPGTHLTATPLHTASYQGQLEVVKLLIELQADPTIVEPRYNSTALGWASHGKHTAVLHALREYVPRYRRKTEGGLPAVKSFAEAVFAGDAARVKSTLETRPLTPQQLDGPWFHFDAPAVVQAKRNLAVLDVLIAAGANINKKSDWWAGGFGVLDGTDSELAASLMKRGAKLDVWSAAELGRLPELRAMIEHQPQLVHAPGPDGKRPLHCAKDVVIAEYLVSRGADIDAVDIDHSSTAAQYHVKDRPEVTRYLIQQGCRTDIMQACVLGDEPLVASIVDDSPATLETIVSRQWFPSDAADSIYCWALGWYVTPHEVAQRFQHTGLVEWLFAASVPSWSLVNACLLGRDDKVDEILKRHPAVIEQMPPRQRQQLAHSARNNQTVAVKAMLEAGMPPDVVGQHQATPLHWAAFHGNLEMVHAILKYNPPLDAKDRDFQATPLGWAQHGSEHGWNLPGNDYPATIAALQSLV